MKKNESLSREFPTVIFLSQEEDGCLLIGGKGVEYRKVGEEELLKEVSNLLCEVSQILSSHDMSAHKLTEYDKEIVLRLNELQENIDDIIHRKEGE